MMNVSVFNDVKTTAGQVIEAAETTPFLSDKRFILVKDCGFFSEGKKAESDLLADYMRTFRIPHVLYFPRKRPIKGLSCLKWSKKTA